MAIAGRFNRTAARDVSLDPAEPVDPSVRPSTAHKIGSLLIEVNRGTSQDL